MQSYNPHRQIGRLTNDILLIGEHKLRTSTLTTFNKKMKALIDGNPALDFSEEEDEIPAPQFEVTTEYDEPNVNIN